MQATAKQVDEVVANVSELSERFAGERAERQDAGRSKEPTSMP